MEYQSSSTKLNYTTIRSTLCNDPITHQPWIVSPAKAVFTQLCFWTKILNKQWLVLGASAFQCMRSGFLWPKCCNIACLHSPQDQNELHLKKWFFSVKIGIFCKSICRNICQRCSSVYTSIFVQRMDKTNYLSNQTWAKYYHSRNKH